MSGASGRLREWQRQAARVAKRVEPRVQRPAKSGDNRRIKTGDREQILETGEWELETRERRMEIGDRIQYKMLKMMCK